MPLVKKAGESVSAPDTSRDLAVALSTQRAARKKSLAPGAHTQEPGDLPSGSIADAILRKRKPAPAAADSEDLEPVLKELYADESEDDSGLSMVDKIRKKLRA